MSGKLGLPPSKGSFGRGSVIHGVSVSHKESGSGRSNSGKKLLNQPTVAKQSGDLALAQPICDFPQPPVQVVSQRYAHGSDMPQLPKFGPQQDIGQLALQKIRQCSRICDFSDPRADASAKSMKAATLNEMIDCYRSARMVMKLTRECHQSLIEMFAENVFRPLPNIPRALMSLDEVTIEDTAWPHLQLIYILFLTFLECGVDLRILQFQLTPRFITNLFAILDFPDDRERIQARQVISTIFKKVPAHHPLLRLLTISSLASVPEGHCQRSVSHLLQLLHLFIVNATIPLPSTFISAFQLVVLPLHLLERLPLFFEQLLRTVILYVMKDHALIDVAIPFLLSHWPLTSDNKAALFVSEIEQILTEVPSPSLLNSVLEYVAMALESPCLALANAALCFVGGNAIRVAITKDPDNLLPLVFGPILRVAGNHWHENIQYRALNLLNGFMSVTGDSFLRVAEETKDSTALGLERRMIKKSMWRRIAVKARRNLPTIDLEAIFSGFEAFFVTGVAGPSTMQMDERSDKRMHRSSSLGAEMDGKSSSPPKMVFAVSRGTYYGRPASKAPLPERAVDSLDKSEVIPSLFKQAVLGECPEIGRIVEED
jgi:serine/threonine-protein phosphatase 2A regulatory subunit B'